MGGFDVAEDRMELRPASRVRDLDWLMLAVACLCCLGLTMAVSVQAVRDNGSALQAIEAQGAKLVFGLGAFVVCALVPLEFLRRHAVGLWALGLLATAAALGFDNHKGASRWITVGGSSFQPIEVARLALVIITAAWIARSGPRLREFVAGFVRVLLPGVLLAGVLAMQPDLGNALLCLSLVSAMGLAAGIPARWFTIAALPMIPVLAGVVMARGYAVGRISAYFGAEPPYQVQQSITAIGAGGLTGAGLGDGWMKLGFVPEAHNDFVFAIIGEELGFIGGIFVLGLYATIGFVGCRLACVTRDPFCRYIIVGCSLAVCMQALVNLLVTTGQAPAKGIDLPLVSSGGTNLAAMLGAIGLIGNAARSDCRSRS